jgi:hypothetical protein
MNSAARSSRSYRKVAVAVDAVCDVAVEYRCMSFDDVVNAVAAERKRPIEVEVLPLAHGVCGQRRRYDNRDVIVLAAGLPDRARTLAHELGHVVFDHHGTPTAEALLAVDSDLVSYMLNSRQMLGSEEFGEDELAEWEAETFASMLLTRLRVLGDGSDRMARLRFDEALG